jgi:hypothetical protein
MGVTLYKVKSLHVPRQMSIMIKRHQDSWYLARILIMYISNVSQEFISTVLHDLNSLSNKKQVSYLIAKWTSV